MTDTVRTTAALQALLSDGAAAHSTNRQLLRDMVASFDVMRSSVINAQDAPYNADPTGVADSSAALQAAANAVPDVAVDASIYLSRGGSLVVPAGVYRLTAGIVLKRGTTLQGAGSEATIFQYEATTGDIFSYERPNTPMSTQPPIGIKGCRIVVKAGVTHTSGAAVRIDSADPSGAGKAGRVNLEDVQTYFTFEGFRIRNMIGGYMRSCRAYYAGSSGFIFRGFCTLLQVTDCHASGCTSHGWDISGWSYCNATACGSDSNGGYGWYVKRLADSGAMYGNSFKSIGSEQSTAGLFLFEYMNATEVLCFGIANPGVGFGATVDGVVITNCTGLTITPWISTEAAATGYPFKITDPTVSASITLIGGSVGYFAAGTRQFNGVENLTTINFQSRGDNSFGGATDTGGVPQAMLSAVRRTGVAGTAGRVISDFRSISSDGFGSVVARISANNGGSYAQFEHNSTGSGPFSFGSFGDAIFRATSTLASAKIHFVIGTAIRATLSALGYFTASRFLGNGTAHVAGDYALSAGWGTTATVNPVAAKDTGGRVTVWTTGTGQTANPTVTLTFKDGTWTTVPSITVSRGDAIAPADGYWALTTPSATAPVFTFVGTPAPAALYVLDFTVMGK